MNKPILLPPFFTPPRTTDPAQGTYAAPQPQLSETERLERSLRDAEKRITELDLGLAHLAATVRKVEGQMLEERRLFDDTLAHLDNERELYARKFNDLQGLVKRLLEQKG